eukprot:3900073-Pyramimonas_sp.AAC.3
MHITRARRVLNSYSGCSLDSALMLPWSCSTTWEVQGVSPSSATIRMSTCTGKSSCNRSHAFCAVTLPFGLALHPPVEKCVSAVPCSDTITLQLTRASAGHAGKRFPNRIREFP